MNVTKGLLRAREAQTITGNLQKISGKKTRFSKEQQLALLFIAPTVLTLLALIGWPIVYSLSLSFHEVAVVGGKMEQRYAGLENYLNLLRDSRFQLALIQTVIFTVARVTAVMIISLVLALFLNQATFGAELFKRLFLLPWALSFVVNALMWGWIYHGSYGLLNAILLRLGLIDQYHVWLANPHEAMVVIIFASVWKAVPFATLMTLAALKTVPEELMDAAKVDGAGAWARFRHITLPWIKPVTLVLLVIETMWSLKAFDIIWILTKGGPMDRTMILNVFAYQQTWQFFKFGYGSAAAYIVTGIILLLTVAYFKLLHGFED